MNICGVKGCGRKSIARGLCQKHYARLRTRLGVSSLPKAYCRSVAERLRSYVQVDPESGCHVWRKGVSPHGYGLCCIGAGRRLMAHRLSWELAHGPIPNGLCVLHRCDNRLCVNPEHLHLGTRAQNAAEMAARGRVRGKYSPRGTLLHPPMGYGARPRLARRFPYGPRVMRVLKSKTAAPPPPPNLPSSPGASPGEP